jgi:excisionase family DNA binding protein
MKAVSPTDDNRLLDVHEAAALLAVKPTTLYQWAYQRRIPVVKLFGPRGALRFRRSDIDALVAQSLRPALRERA